MKAYSADLRLRIVAAVDGGMPRSAAARVFGVARATVKRYLALRREAGGLAPRPRRGPPPIKTAALAAALPPRLAAAPDATLAEHCTWYEQAARVRVSDATLSRVIGRVLGWTRKKTRTANSA
jgi:transposase